MRLRDLLKYDNIVIQCHDNPDADAIGSGFAVYSYLKNMGKESRIIYSGINKIHKINLRHMVETLDVPIEYIKNTEKIQPQLLIMVDCQYGEGNVTKFDAENIAVIDHHQGNGNDELREIRCDCGSCCSILYNMLIDENYPLDEDINLSTALYYGLYMDTNGFMECRHASEREMIDNLNIREDAINKFINSNFTLEEIQIAGNALNNMKYNLEYGYAIIYAQQCDPNLLGFLSDLVLKTDKIDSCVAYSEQDGGYKISVRNCNKDITALKIAEYIVEGAGDSGGHINKSGGFIYNSYFTLNREINIEDYIDKRIKAFFGNAKDME